MNNNGHILSTSIPILLGTIWIILLFRESRYESFLNQIRQRYRNSYSFFLLTLIHSSDRVFNIPHSNDISHLIVTEIPHMTTPYIYATNTCRKRLSGRYSLYTNSTRLIYASSYDRQCI